MLDTIPQHRPQDIPNHKRNVLWALYVPVCITICVLGTIGNILSLIVWRRLRKKSRVGNISTTTYFMLLSYVDIGVLLTTLPTMTLPYLEEGVLRNRAFAVFFSYIGHPLHYFLIFLSIYMVVAMSIDRVRLVFRPFSRYSQNQKYTYLMIAIFTGIAFFLNIPSFFEFKPEQDHYTGKWKLTEIRYLHRREFRDAVFTTHCIGVIVLPWMTMFIANIFLIVKSSRRLKSVRSMSTNEEEYCAEHRQMTYTLIFVSMTSLVLLAVQCISRCVTMFYYIDSSVWPRIHYAREIGNMTLPLNSALNFILFCLPGKRFRKEMMHVVKTLLSRNRRVAPTTSTNTTLDTANEGRFAPISSTVKSTGGVESFNTTPRDK